MRFEKHLMSSIPLAAVVYFYFKSKIITLAFLIGYIFIDLDHLPDYFITYGINLNIVQFFEATYNFKYKTLILFLHSYELLALIWFSLWIFKLDNLFLVGMGLGFTIHIILDHLTNPIHPMGYFFIFRSLKGFKANRLRKDRQKGRVGYLPR